jgi:uncharacterized protein (TIGR03435 family)
VEKRNTPAYALTKPADGFGPNSRRAAFDCSDMQVAKKGLVSISADGMPDAARAREMVHGRRVARCALGSSRVADWPSRGRHDWDNGRFDIRFEFTLASADPDQMSIFTAVRDQLGLQLESRTVPLDVLVIDSISHPSEH